MGRVVDPRSFNDLVVATINGAPVRVRDIGRAEDGTKEQRSAVRVNGVPTVILDVRRQSGDEHGGRDRGGQEEPGPARADAAPAT